MLSFFFFSSRRRHTRCLSDWSSDVCSSDLPQELRLVPTLSIAENIALGDLPVRRFGPLATIDRGRMREQARNLPAELDFAPDPRAPVTSLSFSKRQRVAVAKALHRTCPIILLDSPTAL